jgi:hypothetical protein
VKQERLTPYEEWMVGEGIPIVSGWVVENVMEVAREPLKGFFQC